MTVTQSNVATGRLILVEDDTEVRRSLTMMLRARGYTMDVYRSGDEIVSTRAVAVADCMLIDYRLPGLNGFQVLEKLRRSGHIAPAILITGVITADLPLKARIAGFAQTLVKPMETGGLIDCINALIANNAPPQGGRGVLPA